ncbi:AAA family ATPase [Candidatus Parabeggiatoa sp. HSG14]|uniref:AAA family ATPase n=1 Tax=Candidatus Parabeggiatoa sp. HSG14 TaxID=3055593 RepID=UPI0025A74769|nr:AAA family ATPase [Thiotrichales bacterium HSG14]
MHTLPGYLVTAKIYESDISQVYRGIRKQDKLPVILKLLKKDYPTDTEIAHYQQEYRITHSSNLKGVIKALALEKYQNTRVIVFEDFGAESLKQLIKQKPLTINNFLDIAIKCSEIFGEIHAASIIYKDTNPSNIVINVKTGQIKLIDFGISSIASYDTHFFKNSHPQFEGGNGMLEGTPAYMSPEQTGRMSRAVDYRTDFYSLGVTFYELLTRKLPFDALDTMELVHCHLAKQPISPHQLNPDIPLMISNIIMKLLEKTVETRYQNAWGLKADLEICQTQLQIYGKIETFTLGNQDISDQFQIPSKLYGRNNEIETLLTALERVNQNCTEIILVTGQPGVGKTTLVQEVHKLYASQSSSLSSQEATKKNRHKVYFIEGKCDPFQQHIPYSALVMAFRSFIQRLLTESEEQLSLWQEKFLKAFGPNGQVMIDVIPEIGVIIGPQLPVQPLPPTEAQNRLMCVFLNFIHVFCCKAIYPLAIFLDNLQWADTATLKLIELLMINEETQYLLLIGTYRENEVNDIHPLMITLKELCKEKTIAQQIVLSPLSLENITDLIADTLHYEMNETKTVVLDTLVSFQSEKVLHLEAECWSEENNSLIYLAEVVRQKTGGNPLFVKEFLKMLYQERLLTFTPPASYEKNGHKGTCQTGDWQWDIAPIKAMTIPDNIVELVIEKLKKLPEKTQQVLCIAACMGNCFDLNMLSLIYEQSEEDISHILIPAVQEGLIIQKEKLKLKSEKFNLCRKSLFARNKLLFSFLHNRVQQATYALLDNEQRKVAHFKIGKLLLTDSLSTDVEESIFELVNHLNIGHQFIEDDLEKFQSSILNLVASRKAKETMAYAAALQYLTTSLSFLESIHFSEKHDIWTDYYQLALTLHKELAEMAYLNGDFSQCEKLIHSTLIKIDSLLEKAALYQLRIMQYNTMAKYDEAIQHGKIALKLLCMILPEEDLQTVLRIEINEIKKNLGNKEILSLEKTAKMTSIEKRTTLKLLNSMAPSAYFSNSTLWMLIAAKMVNLSLRYGHLPESAYGYAVYGIVVGVMLQDYQSAYQFGKLSLNLSRQFADLGHQCKNAYIVANYLNHWVRHIKSADTINDEAHQAALESGELQLAGSILTCKTMNSFHQGKNLKSILGDLTHVLQFTQRTKNNWDSDAMLGCQFILLNLTGLTADKEVFCNDNLSEAYYLERCQSHQSFMGLCLYYIQKLEVLYLYGKSTHALIYALKAKRYLSFITGLFSVAVYNFYYSLSLIALYPITYGEERKQYWRQLESNQQQMKNWADNCPHNFLHLYFLVEAEMARINGKELEAIDLYEQAISLAKEYDFIQHEALANELTAKFWLYQGKDKYAKLHFKDAVYGYQRWDAKHKVEELKRQYPILLSSQTSETAITDISTTTTYFTMAANSSKLLDFATVIKASQAIAGEIELDRLLKKLMKVVIENAGAQRGFLILNRAGQWVIEAEGKMDETEIAVLQSIPLIASTELTQPCLPTNLINYVIRTQESVVLQDATEDEKFALDPYIVQHHVKSILCMPLINQNKLTGMLYLENNLMTGAFTQDRLEVLNALSSQMAISIDNAKLYADTQALNAKLRESETRLIQFLEAMPVGVFIISADGHPYYANQRAQQLLGKGIVPSTDADHLVSVYQVYIAGTDQVYPQERQPLMRALQGENVTVDDLEIHQGNKRIPIEVWGTPIFCRENGNIAYAIAVFQDITERKQAEKERIGFTKELTELNKAYERFVPREFLSLLDKKSVVDVQLGDQVAKEMTILFSDIREFTARSEKMTPHETFKFINAFLSRMEPSIIEHQGFIDKYIGDAIMALFNSPDDALKAGITMLSRLSEYNTTRQRPGRLPIEIGVGINTGSLMLGTVGGQSRMDGTVIADAVNLASRVEDLTKTYGTSLLITEQTYQKLKDTSQYNIRVIDRVKVKGKTKIATIYEVFDADLPECMALKIKTRQDFEEGFRLYHQKELDKAQRCFEKVLQINKKDEAARVYWTRCTSNNQR